MMKYDVEEKERRDERHAEKHADLATSKQWYMGECGYRPCRSVGQSSDQCKSQGEIVLCVDFGSQC